MASYFGRSDKPEGALKRAQGRYSRGGEEDGGTEGRVEGLDGWMLSVYRLGLYASSPLPLPPFLPSILITKTTDLISVGNKVDALKLLHDVITAKR